MSHFDEMFAASARPLLFGFNADKDRYTYTSPDGNTVYQNLEVMDRELRWELEQTDSGERRYQVRSVSVRTEDLPQLEQRGTMTDASGEVWLIERVMSQSPTVTWMELSSHKKFEQAGTAFRRTI